MVTNVEDFQLLLSEAISEAKMAGLEAPALQLEASVSSAFTTSSELPGETGVAIMVFMRSAGGIALVAVIEKLNHCLAEVRKVWSSI